MDFALGHIIILIIYNCAALIKNIIQLIMKLMTAERQGWKENKEIIKDAAPQYIHPKTVLQCFSGDGSLS